MTSAYLACTTRRLSLRVGVSSSVSAVHSTGSRCHRLTCWTRASCWWAAATPAATSASTCGSLASSASELAGMPRARAQAGAASPARGSRAATYGRRAAGGPASGVDGAEVPVMQPPVRVKEILGQAGPVQVAGGGQRPAGQDLAVAGDRDLHAGVGAADRAQLERGGGVGR